jgi:hypothetical protein
LFPIGKKELIHYTNVNSLHNPLIKDELLFKITPELIENIFHESLTFSSVIKDSLLESGYIDQDAFSNPDELDLNLSILESQFKSEKSEYKGKNLSKPGYISFTGINHKKFKEFLTLLIKKANIES